MRVHIRILLVIIVPIIPMATGFTASQLFHTISDHCQLFLDYISRLIPASNPTTPTTPITPTVCTMY